MPLSADEERGITRLLLTTGSSYSEIARCFGVHRYEVSALAGRLPGQKSDSLRRPTGESGLVAEGLP